MVNLVILILLSGLLFFLGLGSMGLTDRDEGRNAEAGREMLETGNWVSPTFNYAPRFAKPALVYWLMSLSYRWLGIDEFAARFPSAAFGGVLIVLQYLFVSRFCGAVVGLLSALMLLLNIEMIGLSQINEDSSTGTQRSDQTKGMGQPVKHGDGHWTCRLAERQPQSFNLGHRPLCELL